MTSNIVRALFEKPHYRYGRGGDVPASIKQEGPLGMPVAPIETLFAEQALLPDCWARDVLIHYSPTDGRILKIERDAKAGGDEYAKIVIPGMPNLHSHAFQRAMAGLAERAGGKDDSFWTWRQTMYGLVAKVGPDDMEAIAAQLYAEMLCQGYTSVAEFHYLHNRPDGGRYACPAETALRVARAAEESGIAMTLLPVLYNQGGFNREPLSPAQERFRGDPEFLAEIAGAVEKGFVDRAFNRTGLAIHSLRAAGEKKIREAVLERTLRDRTTPIHIHIAEQVREVTECYGWSQKTPVEWLYEHFPVDKNWCLVHATNVTRGEIDRIAASGAIAGLCPTTEANLGDGLFPFRDFMAQGGSFGIGSDSHVSVSPVEELRWLEYGQRLVLRRRNIAADNGNPSVGGSLWRAALSGGARALGLKVGVIAKDHRADLLILDHDHVLLEGRAGDDILDSLVFAGNTPLVKRVLAGGRWVVEDGRHVRADAIKDNYRKTVRELF
jgi:formimidoylglutamate deiminase